MLWSLNALAKKKKSHAHEKNFDEPHQVVTEEIGSPRAINEIMRSHFSWVHERKIKPTLCPNQ